MLLAKGILTSNSGTIPKGSYTWQKWINMVHIHTTNILCAILKNFEITNILRRKKYYSDVRRSPLRPQLPATRLSFQEHVQANKKWNIKASYSGPLWGKKTPVTGDPHAKSFPFHVILRKWHQLRSRLPGYVYTSIVLCEFGVQCIKHIDNSLGFPMQMQSRQMHSNLKKKILKISVKILCQSVYI